MTKIDLIVKLKEFMNYRDKTSVPEITEKTHLEKDLGLDSLDRIELWFFLEEEAQVVVSDSEIKKVKTVDDLIKLIEEYN